MYEFYPYKHYSKIKNNSVTNPNMLHKTVRARISGDLLKQFREYKSYSGMNEGKFLRTLIKEALNKREADSWAQEVANL